MSKISLAYGTINSFFLGRPGRQSRYAPMASQMTLRRSPETGLTTTSGLSARSSYGRRFHASAKEKAINGIASTKVEHERMSFKRPIPCLTMIVFLALNLSGSCYAKDKIQTPEEKKQYEEMVKVRNQALSNLDRMFARYDREQRTGKNEPYTDEEHEKAYQILKQELTALSSAFETIEKEASKSTKKLEASTEQKKQ